MRIARLRARMEDAVVVYWVNTFTSIRDEERLRRYVDQAGPAMLAGGGRFLARGEPLVVLEGESALRTTIIEFPDLDAAVAAYHSASYQEALRVLGDGATREIRVIAAADPANASSSSAAPTPPEHTGGAG